MSKLKKIISVVLIVTMLMTVAPVSMFASAYAPSYTYGSDPTYTHTEYYVDTSATDPVVRVANSSNPFQAGTSVQKTTDSGIPDVGSAVFSASGYAGETPRYPTISVKFVGRKPSEIVSIRSTSALSQEANISTTNGKVGESIAAVNGKSAWEWTWTVSGGTAVDDDDIIWEIKYKFAGDDNTYTAYAYQHVERTLRQSGYTVIVSRGSIFSRNTYMAAAVTIQGKNVYSLGFHGSKDWNRGYINYLKGGWDSGNEAIMGLGQSTEGNWTTAETAFAVRDDADGTMVSYYNKMSGSTGNYGETMLDLNGNRPWTKAYLDIRRDGGNIENINLREVIISGESAKNEYTGFCRKWVSTSNVNNPGSWSSVTQPSGFKPKEVILDDGTKYTVDGTTSYGDKGLLKAAGNWMMVKFQGTLGIGSYDYAVVTELWAANNSSHDKTVYGYNGISMSFEVYNTTDLYNVYTGILKGTGSYSTTLHAADTVTFNKGVNPSSSTFTDATQWSEFQAAMHVAGRLLQTPDTTQSAINSATSNLIAKYEALQFPAGYSSTVKVKVNHYISGTTTEVAPAQWIDLNGDNTADDVPAGAMATGYALTNVSAYALEGTRTSDTILVDGKSNPAEITFYYTPSMYHITIYANNDISGPEGKPDGVINSNDYYRYENIAQYGQEVETFYGYQVVGEKEFYVLEGLYYDSALTNRVPEKFTMPASNLNLYAKWVTAPLSLYVDPQISGKDPIKVGEVTPNEDATVAVLMNKPATDPYVEGYIFTGYYADAGLTTALEWPQEFYLGESDRTVYGRFVDVNGKIIFESNGGSAVEDLAFTAGTPVNAPADPIKEGYEFKGWYTDNTFSTPITWPVTLPDNTGFVAYAKWEAEMHSISFNLNNSNPTPYDTQSIAPRYGYADTAIPSDRIPAAPRRFGYVFDRWMYNDGTGYKVYNFKTYPKKDIELVAQWRGVNDSAFIGIEGYEKLSGEYKTIYNADTNPDGAKIQNGDVVTFRMTSYANFYVGSTLFVFMYDKDFFEIVPGTTTMFKLNGNNEYVSGINATFTEVTDSSLLEARWPDAIASEMSNYSAMQIAIDPTVAIDDYDVAPMKDGEWLVEFQLRVKDNATGSGTVYMDNAWTRTASNPMGTMFYGWAEKGDAVFDTTNDTVYPDLESATVTVVLDETAPVDTTVILNAAPGAFEDGTTSKTYTGRAETEIVGYTEPTRVGYELTGWTNADATSDYTAWAEGYYAKEGYPATLTFNAEWKALPFPADFYMSVGGAHFKQVQIDYNAVVTAPAEVPTMQGYEFAGWSTDGENVLADLGTMDTTDGKKYYAVWAPATDTEFNIEVYVLAEGTSAYETYSYTGTTDSTVKVVREADVPATPEEGVTYITVESIEEDLEYYVLDANNADNTLPLSGTIAPDGSLVLKLYFEGKPVTVTFDADGGKFSNGEGQYLSIGSFNEVIAPPTEIPTMYGYDFVEWIDFSEDYTYYEDETFFASWTPTSTNIQFIADGVQIGDLVVTEFGKAPKAPTAPAKAGWEFKGWKETADGTTYITTLPAVDVINDETTGIAKTYYAHYEQTEINVVYKVDGVIKYTDKYFAGADVTIRAAESKTGYNFSGWKFADGSDAVNFTMGEEEVIITGTFEAKVIGIVFNANGGTFADGEETTVNTTFNTTINLPAEPTKAGYTFKGWATSATATSGSTSLGTLTAESGKYYAVWEANTVDYYIDIYVMDTAGAYELSDTVTESAKVDSEVSYTATARDGFEISAESVLAGTVPATGELRLQVKYERNKWNLITVMDGNTVDTVSYYFEQAVVAPAEPQKEGYSFGGWTPEVPATMPNNDVTLTATMTANNYNVIYDYNGGTYQGAATTTLSKTYGTVIPNEIQTDSIVYEGYTFLHWINVATGEVVEFTDTTPVVPVDGITFKAVYSLNSYTVTYSNRGTTVETFSVPYGTSIADIKASFAPGEDVDITYTGYTFTDWNWAAIGETMPARDVTVLAQWQINTYKITFNENGGTPVEDIETTYGASTNFSGETTKSGYAFEYWYLDDENTEFSIPLDMPALDELYGSNEITLNAKWTVKSYTITFDSKGGSAVDEITANYGDAIAAPADPELKGYTFDYWYLSDVNTPFVFDSTMPALDDLYGANAITLNAKWTVKTITITFNSNGGSEVAPIVLNYGDYIANRPADPTMEGYTFAGWTLDGAPYTLPEYMEHDEDITVEATWEKNQYTINFNSNGGSATAAIIAMYGDAITVPANPTREGYEFKHWYYRNPAEAYDFGTTMPALDVKHNIRDKSITLTAAWEIQQYTITFDTDGGSAIEAITADFGAAIAKPSDPTKDGYEFIRWDKEIPATMPAEDMTITAIWEANEYTIVFEENGGSDVEDITKAYDTAVTAPANPVKEGHEFLYWYEQGSEDTAYVFDKMPLGGTTLYAKWDAIEYTININANGGTAQDGSEIASIVQDYGTAVNNPGTPVKIGNTFEGWYIVGTDTKYEFPATMPAENVDVEARWTVNTYDVIFYNYDGTEFNKTSPEFGTAINAAPAGEPVREHYTFVGWSLTNDTTDDETETPIDFATANLTVEVDGNKFYPIFKRVPVKLELVAGSSARITTDNAEGDITGYIYGIATKTNVAKLTANYLSIVGDGELIITPTKYNYCGTGTKVEVYDKVDQKVVETYYIVIFGDLNGDSAVDTIDRSMLLNETFGNTIWSQPKNLDGTDNDDYAYYRVLAADLDGNRRIDDTDSALLTEATLYAATIKQEVELTTESKMVHPN